MQMNERMAAALNAQVTSELSASLTYLQMATYFDAESRPGMTHWMYHQSDEEAEHARAFIDHIVARGGRVAIGAIVAPPSNFDGPVNVFEASLERERSVTAEIRDLYEIAIETGDLESLPFLHTFLAEQVEEEAMVETILDRLRRVEGSEVGFALIDSELATRKEEA